MLFACQYCGGLEACIIAGACAAWCWGAYMLARVFWWLKSSNRSSDQLSTKGD